MTVGRVSAEERKRVEKTRVKTDEKAKAGHSVLQDGEWIFVPDVIVELPAVKRERSDFTSSVEPATWGTCMFCSSPFANLRFKNDDSVRLCVNCVRN